MDDVTLLYDLQLVCLHLLIYLLRKDHDEKHNNNKNNNIMTFKYDLCAANCRYPVLITIIFNIVLMVLRQQVDRVGEKVVVVHHHYEHSHHRRRRRCRSSVSTSS